MLNPDPLPQPQHQTLQANPRRPRGKGSENAEVVTGGGQEHLLGSYVAGDRGFMTRSGGGVVVGGGGGGYSTTVGFDAAMPGLAGGYAAEAVRAASVRIGFGVRGRSCIRRGQVLGTSHPKEVDRLTLNPAILQIAIPRTSGTLNSKP